MQSTIELLNEITAKLFKKILLPYSAVVCGQSVMYALQLKTR